MQPDGREEVTVLVWVLFEEQDDQSEYVKDVQAVGAIYVHVCVKDSGLPPVHLDGSDEVIVLVCLPLEEQADQSEYVKNVQTVDDVTGRHPEP